MAKKNVARKSADRRTTARAAAAKKKTAGRKVRKTVPRKVPKTVSKPAAPTQPRPLSRKSPAVMESELKRLDKDILKLINRRAHMTTKLYQSGPNPQEALYDPHAEEELWERLRTANTGPLPWDAVRGVFRAVLSAARQQVRSQRVAYLGPPFSFTHLAAIERFGQSADLVPVNTIASVFEEVNRGHVDFGLVPIENSTDGRVVDTLDMFTRLPLRICGEIQISVHHNLLSRSPRSEITEVYSKPQALSQCRDWLARNMPQSRLIEVTSTSTAAQLARDKPGAAAVASRQAAVEYDLQIVAERIEDNHDNVTRFAIIGDENDMIKPSGRDRTALLMQIAHKPGSLAEALLAFKKSRVNLTWIESFPLRGAETGYLFFLDFEGHVSEPRVRRTLDELERKTVRMEILGSYPRSEPI